ncbi:FAD-binding oxidoreductase [Phaeobacter sp. J2-8]|uniref:FAD-binding oxidoreductase n=1 Tax=Phaeobacter sp. J2-8 TaxID=2931394 RepID=UPI001FD4F7DF|nr:FAD-binding oxidoreductase [Phaeobacter sp. J2-8]MCJ7874686.1 FAD-binding oxidoreductase [Phaeobacter sp. J2-8]
MTDLTKQLSDIVGAAHVLTGSDAAGYLTDWTGQWTGAARAVVRPGSTAEVAAVVNLAGAQGVPVTVQGGNTSVAGGSVPGQEEGGLLLSLARMNRVRSIDARARTVTVDAGAIIQSVQDAVAPEGLDYPLMFGARGSATVGGALATNAGGSNVLRYGNARDLCLGVEAVLPNGEVVHGLTGLRKDNTGYDLKNLLIGSEGTLGIITAAVLKLVPTPKVRSTAFLAVPDLKAALDVLNALQDASGGLVEAFEWLPAETIRTILRHNSALRAPLDVLPEHGVLVELASTRRSDAGADDTGTVRLDALMLETVEGLMEDELVTDGFFATSEQQRIDLWSLREAVLETIQAEGPFLSLDASLPLARVAEFIDRVAPLADTANLRPLLVAHLGDGNVHYAVVAAQGCDWDALDSKGFGMRVGDILAEMGGSFSAEHGIGRTKVATLAARKDSAQLGLMHGIRQVFDPLGLLNPGVMLEAG